MTVREAPPRSDDGSLLARDWVLIAAIALLPSLFSIWAIPLGAAVPDPSCAPDEAAHMQQVAALARGDTSAWPARDSRMSMHLQTPYLPHLAALAAARAGADPAWAYRFPLVKEVYRGFPVTRLASVALGVLGVLALAAAVATATGSRDAGRFAGLVAALFPQRFFISSYVNGDAATFAAGALLVLALARWRDRGESAVGLPLVGIACGAVLLAKPNGYVLLPPTALWLAWSALRGAREEHPRALPLRDLVRAALIAVAIATPVLVWNGVRLGSLDVLGIGAYRSYLASDAWHGAAGMTLPENAPWVFARALARSSFMKFGNMSLAIPSPLYAVWLVSLPAGLLLAARRLHDAPASTWRAAAWIGGVAAFAFAAAVYECFWVDFSPQGRYVLLPVVILTLVSWLGWTSEGDRVLRRRVLVGYLAVVALWSLALLVVMPCGAHVALPASP